MEFKDIIISAIAFMLLVTVIGLTGSITSNNNEARIKSNELYNELRMQDSIIITLKSENIKLNRQIELLLEYNKDKK